MHPNRQLNPNRHSRALLFFLATVYIFFVSSLDYLTSAEISLTVLYLPSIFIFSWHFGKRLGIAASFLSAFLWLCGHVFIVHPYSHIIIAYWNAIALLSIFTVFSFVISNLEMTLKRQRDQVTDLQK